MVATPAQAARLAAGAKGGTQGAEAFDAAQRQVASGRDQAIANLQRTAAQAHAPGALTTQLSAQLAQPAATALSTLSTLGAAAGSASTSEDSALGNYMTEANSAIPLIRAEDDRQLGQQIALLNAGRAHSGSSGGGGAPLSDSELRTRLLGMATQNRQAVLTRGEAQFRAALANAQAHLAYSSSSQPEAASQAFRGGITPAGGAPSWFGQAFPGQAQPQGSVSQAAVDALAKRRNAIYATEHGAAQQREQAIITLKNNTYGPGLVEEAQQLGLAAGVDPMRVYGTLTPNYDEEYVNANKKLGLYQDPNQTNVTGQTLPLTQAAKEIGLNPTQAQAIAGKTHFVWSDPNSAANKGLAAFLGKPTDPSQPKVFQVGNTTYDLSTPDGLHAAQQAFMQQGAAAQQYATPVVGDVLDDAKRAVTSGLDFTTWINNLRSTPEFRYDPQSFILGFAQAKPLFDYAAALHSRQATAPADPTTYLDPSAG